MANGNGRNSPEQQVATAIWRLEGMKACAHELQEYFHTYELQEIDMLLDAALHRARVASERPQERICKPWTSSK